MIFHKNHKPKTIKLFLKTFVYVYS